MRSADLFQAFSRPIAGATFLVLFGGLFAAFGIPLDPNKRILLVVLIVGYGFFTFWLMRTVMAQARNTWLLYVITLTHILAIAVGDLLVAPLDISPLYAIVVIIVAVIGRRRAALYAALVASICQIAVQVTLYGNIPIFGGGLLRVGLYFLSAYLVSELTHALTLRWRTAATESERRRGEIERRKNELEGLHDISRALENLQDAQEMYRQLTKRIAGLLNAELCILARFDETRSQILGTPPGYGLSDEQISAIVFKVDAQLDEVWNVAGHEFMVLNDISRLPPFILPLAHRLHLRQIAGARLIWHDVPIGVIFVANPIQRTAFSESDGQLLSILADQAAIAVENTQLYREAQGTLEKVTRLYAISTQFAAQSDPDEIPMRVVNAVAQALDAPIATIALFNEAKEILEYAATVGVPPQAAQIGFRKDGFGMRILQAGQARFIEDIQFADNVSPVTQTWGYRAVACLPIYHSGKPLGVLYVNYSEPHVFSVIEKNILATFANQTAIALENARLHRAEQRRAREFAALANLGRSLAETMDLSQTFQVLMRELATNLPDAETGLLLIYDSNTKQLHARASFGFEKEQLAGLTFYPGEAIAGTVFQTRQAILLNDQETIEELCQTLRPEMRQWLFRVVPGGQPAQAIMCSPVETGGEALGVIVLSSFKSPNAFAKNDLDLLNALADRAALAIRNAQLYAATQHAAHSDSLTQVYNHGYFLERLDTQVELARQTQQSISLIMLDIDFFKGYNDTYGHVFGDRVLQAIVQAIRVHIHQSDLVGRWGGEEFCIGLLDTDSAGAFAVAERIRVTVGQSQLPYHDGKLIAAPTVSQGLSTFPCPAQDAAALIDQADAALYRAKARGRNQVCVANRDW